MTTFQENGASSYCTIPELDYSDGHVKGEEVKRTLITVTDTSLSPNTVVVQFVNTFTTIAAVRHSWHFYEVAFLTIFYLQARVR